MIGYDQYWYTKQLELGLLMPQPQKPLKQPETGVKTVQVLTNVNLDNDEENND